MMDSVRASASATAVRGSDKMNPIWKFPEDVSNAHDGASVIRSKGICAFCFSGSTCSVTSSRTTAHCAAKFAFFLEYRPSAGLKAEIVK